MKKQILLSLMLMTAISLLGETTDTKSNSKNQVLLAFEKTSFKSELIDEMKKQLEETGIKVIVKEHSSGWQEPKAADFNAIFITNSGVRSKVRPWIQDWLKKNSKQKDLILLHTTQTRNWTVKADVDTVTSASSRGDVKKLANDYVSLIKKILKK